MKYRGKLQIIADILSVVRGGAKKTHVMYQANLSFALLKRYLSEVLEAGLVCVDDEDHYTLTGRGQSFLDRFSEYSKSCDLVEQELTHVNSAKTVLESLIVADSGGRSGKRERNRKAT